MKKKFIFHSNFIFNLNLNKCFMLLFTIFSIVIPIGIQPQLQANYVFAESNSQSINDDKNGYSNEGIISSSSSSEFKSQFNQKDPFDSSDNGNKKVKMNFILPDIVEPDLPETQPSPTSSDQIGTDSSSDVHPSSDNKNSINVDNAGANIIIEKDKPTSAELSSTDLQIGTINKNESKSINVNAVNSIVSDDKPGTENSQSQLTSQPKYKSYRDYMEKNNILSDQSINFTNDTQATELSSINSQMDTVNSNVNDNANNRQNTKISSTDDLGSVNSNENSNANFENEKGPLKDMTNEVADNQLTSELSSSGAAAATSGSQVSAQSSNRVYGDFNGDGKDDLAIGVDGESVGSITFAGGVEVIYGASGGLSATSPLPDQFWTQDSANIEDSAEPSDEFGNSLATGDFNGDGKDDLAIGVQREEVGSIPSAGGVEVIYGSSGGLSATSPLPDQFWTQDSPDINDHADQFDRFGNSLATGDFNGDGKDDLAIGVADEDVGTIGDAGGVEVIYGSSAGLSATSPRADQFWTQDSLDINDHADPGDAFGFSLASGDFNNDGRDDLAIGVQSESVGSILGAGGVEVIYGSSAGLSATSPRADQFWMQGNSKVENSPEDSDNFGWALTSGDFNGDGKDDLAIGVPNEGIGSKGAAGGVEVIYGSSAGLSTSSPIADQFWTQDSPDINDHADPGDSFGLSLTSGDFNNDGKDDLAVGVEKESAGSILNAGAVEVIYGSSAGLSATTPRADQLWTQDSTNIEDVAEQNDFFGDSLATGDFNGDARDDLAIGVVGESAGSLTNAGAVEVIYGSSGGLSATSPLPDQFWTQDSPDINDHPDQNDFFGDSLG